MIGGMGNGMMRVMGYPSRYCQRAASRFRAQCSSSSQKILTPQSALDNPYWPSGSSVQVSKDSAAFLPQPIVNGANKAEWTLTDRDMECIAAGAGILASGGGGNPIHGYQRCLEALQKGKKLKLLNPCRLNAEDMGIVCTVALMGDPSAEKGNEGTDGGTTALDRMQQVLASDGKYNASKDAMFKAYSANAEDLEKIDVTDVPLAKKITALTPVETGGLNTIEPIIVAANNDNIIMCLDSAGQGRSYPELQMFMPFIYGCNFCPAVLADLKKDTVTCVAADSCVELENYFRSETVAMGSLSSIAMGPINFQDVFQKMVLFSTSRAWQLGRAMERALRTKTSFLEAIVNQENGYILLEGKVSKVETKSGGGFTENLTTIEGTDDYKGNTVRITAKNENLVAEKISSDGDVQDTLATVPDVISIVDLEASQILDMAVMAGAQVEGKKVAVAVLPTDPRLYTEHALKVVGPRAVGLDMDYQPPKLLK